MATVQLKRGDMFDGPSDLIVLPCSTSGTITDFVRRRLINHRIPYPRPGMQLGDLQVLPFQGGENIAQFVAFAASVEADSSTVAAIEKIASAIGRATAERSTIRIVSAPLLGAGAGNLNPADVVGALTSGFKASAHDDARLVVHVLNDELFESLSAPRSSALTLPPKSPIRVFVSYSHSSPDHEQWVEQLATFLRASGIDARLDAWHLRHGMDLPQFMANELALAERVVLVSDERYAEKADGRVGGVGWETMIIQGDMARLPPDSIKYLVIVRSPKVEDGLPRYLATKFVIHWPSETNTERKRNVLLRELYDAIAPPPIGPPPVFL